MKRILMTALIAIAMATPTIAQKYKTAADTVKLNKEMVSVSNDIAELISKLTIAQNNLPGYHNKAGEANADAQQSANESSRQANKATSGDINDAKSAKRKAGKALNKAEDARDAENKIKSQDKKIEKYTRQIANKQERMTELESMLSAIRGY